MSTKQMAQQLAALLVCSVLAATASYIRADEPPSRNVDVLLSNRDFSVSPGRDFFQYANGTWFARNPIPAGEARWGIAGLVRNQLDETLRGINETAASSPRDGEERLIGDFWASAMDENKLEESGLRPLAPELARIASVKNQAAALDVAFELIRLNVPVLVGMSVDPDRRDSRTNIFYFTQVPLGLPNRDYYLRTDADIAHVRSQYVEYIQSTLRLTAGTASNLASRAAQVLQFETGLAEASRSLAELRDPQKNYNRMTATELTRNHTPSIHWKQQIRAWGASPHFIAVGQPEYFDTLEHLLKQVPLDVLKDYLRFHLIVAYAPYLSPAIETDHFQMYGRTLNGQQALQPRWKRVLLVEDDSTMQNLAGFGVINPIGMLVGKRYVAQHFPAVAKQRYTAMLLNMRETYAERIGRLDWLTDSTRREALTKLAKLGYKVGNPDRWPDYSKLSIARGSYCENMMSIARWAFDQRVLQVGRAVDPNEWRITPQTFDAYYMQTKNEIAVPAANFVVPGMEDSQVDDALAYGYVGSLLGHEITHGFDAAGRRYDAEGNLRDWWSETDSQQFEQRARMLVDQFDAYEPLPGLHINGKATLGENIADLGGLVIALESFKRTDQFKGGAAIGGLSPLQRFLLAYALGWMSEQREEALRNILLSDVHSPAKWRVNGALSNLDEFYSAFDINADAPMWRPPERRARIW